MVQSLKTFRKFMLTFTADAHHDLSVNYRYKLPSDVTATSKYFVDIVDKFEVWVIVTSR